MKKSLIALAALASAGIASAQSSVTVFGTVDLGLQHVGGSLGGKTHLSNAGIAASAIGFRGVEDLGGGLSAGFHLEADINADSGSGGATNANNQPSGGGAGNAGIMFNRRSTVSLMGSWGEVRLGRDYTPQIRSLGLFDPFWFQGPGSSLLAIQHAFTPAGIRASNSIGYLYNTDGWGNGPGFYTEAKYWLGENPSNTANKNDGTGYGLRVGYATGPFNAALAMSKTEYLAGDVKLNNVAASWDFGVARAMAQYARNSEGAVHGRGYLVGAMMPVGGAGLLRASYNHYRSDAALSPTSNKWQVGYVHNLSKRTALYGTYSHTTNNAGANFSYFSGLTGFGSSASAYEAGLKHSF